MRSWWILILLAVVLAGGAAVVFMGDSDDSGDAELPAAPDQRGTPEAEEPGTELSGARVRRPNQPEVPTPKPKGPPKTEPKPSEPDAEQPGGQLILEARDLTWQKPLRGARFDVRRHQHQDNGQLAKAPVDLNQERVVVAVPLNVELQVSAEVDGFTPALPQRVTLSKQQPSRTLVFQLQHAAPFSGIELRIFQADGKPATRLQVKAMRRERGEWQRLWHRQKGEATGIYRLPDLRPGRYRLECQVVDAQGKPTDDLPSQREVDFSGGSQHLVQHVCQLGGRVRVKVRDANGQAPAGMVSVQLVHRTSTGTVKVESVWDQLPPNKDNQVCLNCFGNGHGQLRVPVAAGNYQIIVVDDATKARGERRFDVQAGQAGRIEVTLR